MADLLPNSIPDLDGLRARWGSFAFTEANDKQAKVIVDRYPPGRQQSAIIPLLDELALSPGDVAEVLHGTTVGSNTLLQRSGAATGLITTRGSTTNSASGSGAICASSAMPISSANVTPKAKALATKRKLKRFMRTSGSERCRRTLNRRGTATSHP